MSDVHWDFCPNTAALIGKHLVGRSLDDAIVRLLDQFFVIFANHLSQPTVNIQVNNNFSKMLNHHANTSIIEWTQYLDFVLTGSSPNVNISHSVTANIHESEE